MFSCICRSEVEAQLLVEFPINLRATKQRPEPQNRFGHQRILLPLQTVRTTKLTAADKRSQLAVSRSI